MLRAQHCSLGAKRHSELQENSVIQKFRITAEDDKNYNTNHYSLEMIIAVGFKVNAERAVQFRKWVNQIELATISLVNSY
jgi:Virulence protein